MAFVKHLPTRITGMLIFLSGIVLSTSACKKIGQVCSTYNLYGFRITNYDSLLDSTAVITFYDKGTGFSSKRDTVHGIFIGDGYVQFPSPYMNVPYIYDVTIAIYPRGKVHTVRDAQHGDERHSSPSGWPFNNHPCATSLSYVLDDTLHTTASSPQGEPQPSELTVYMNITN